MTTSKSKILFQMTGSIAAFKACQVISKLVQAGHQVQVVASSSALKFVGAATLEGLTGRPVASDLWAQGHMMEHIHLIRWADLIVTAPASAHYINRIANGIGDDLLTTLFLAHQFDKPFVLFPAMNTSMYLNPVTQSSITKLRGLGIQILDSASGVLACGEVGYGRLLEPEQILSALSDLDRNFSEPRLEKKKSQKLKVLITSGGTQEPIDPVRVITNKSTGRTGARLAEVLTEFGFDVTLIRAADSVQPHGKILEKTYVTFDDLHLSLRETLQQEEFHTVLHVAAVSDFSLSGTVPLEKRSSEEELVLKFKKNPKLVNSIKAWSKNKSVQLIAFKMTATASLEKRAEAVTKLQSMSQADLVVQNDLSEIAPEKGQHQFRILRASQNFENAEVVNDASSLGEKLGQFIFNSKDVL